MAHRRRSHSQRNLAMVWSLIGVGALVVAVGTLAAFALRPVEAPPKTEPRFTQAPIDAPKPTPLRSISLPGPGGKVVILGDSWSGGYAATPSKKGFMWLTGDHFGWDYTIYPMSGSGYLNDGSNGEGVYLDRLAGAPVVPDASLVVVQGSVNDGGEKLHLLQQASADVVQRARELYPSAQILILGPAPLALPASTFATQMDTALRATATNEQTAYISMITGDWVTPDRIATVVDPTVANHPTTAGHAYLAERMIAVLTALGSGEDTGSN